MSDQMSTPRDVTEGEWAGWRVWAPEPFEEVAGPFYNRTVAGEVECAFRVAPRHLNGMGAVHGGCLMSFADFALFAISEAAWNGGPAVTANLSCDFLGPAQLGNVVRATGALLRTSRHLLFVSGLARVDGAPVLRFSGIIKVRGVTVDSDSGRN